MNTEHLSIYLGVLKLLSTMFWSEFPRNTFYTSLVTFRPKYFIDFDARIIFFNFWTVHFLMCRNKMDFVCWHVLQLSWTGLWVIASLWSLWVFYIYKIMSSKDSFTFSFPTSVLFNSVPFFLPSSFPQFSWLRVLVKCLIEVGKSGHPYLVSDFRCKFLMFSMIAVNFS